MATSHKVLEFMILHADADANSASFLQKQLYRQGIRAGISKLTETNNTEVARHSLCYAEADFDNENSISPLPSSCDSFFINPYVKDAHEHKTSLSIERLIENITLYQQDTLISAPELRRTTQISYDAIAEQFTDVWFDTIPGKAIEAFLYHLPRNGTILDAGCGPGHHSQFFKKQGFDPVGLDFSYGMLEIASAKNDHILFEYGDILHHYLPPTFFDGVWSAVMINHIPKEELPFALRNLVGTLKWKGYIGLNFQIGRMSEIVSLENDHRFFEYPQELTSISHLLESLGVRIISTQVGTTTRNTHSLSLEMQFVTMIGQKVGTL